MRTLVKFYKALALIVFNTLVLLAMLNFGTWVYCGVEDWWRFSKKTGQYFNPDGTPVQDGTIMNYLTNWFDYGAMKEMPEHDAYDLLKEFSSMGGVNYHPWIQYAEREFHGKYINVNLEPLLYTVRKSWNPSPDPRKKTFTIFTFGGSTTFGYQTPDDHTWASGLSKTLNERLRKNGQNLQVKVVNYGHCLNYSSLETELALQLLKRGARPDLMIFADGVNEGVMNHLQNTLDKQLDEPPLTKTVALSFAASQDESFQATVNKVADLLYTLPFFRRFGILSGRHNCFVDPFGTQTASYPESELKAAGEFMYRRYRSNLQMLNAAARECGVQTLFVIQPDAFFNYPLELYVHKPPVSFFQERGKHAEFHSLARKNDSVKYLGDLFQEWGMKKALVDDVHYSPSFNRFLAEKIATYIPLK
jgi:hypothetical protein